MSFGTTPKDNAQVPLGSVYVPGTANSDLTALEGIAINTDGNSQKSSAARMGMLDGDHVSFGAKADAVATSDTGTFTLLALFKRLLQKYQSTSTPMITEDQIRALIAAGQGFSATSGLVAISTAGNYFALGLLASAIAKNVLIYRINAGPVNPSGDVRMTVATSFDAAITAAITPVNNSLGSSTTALATVKAIPTGTGAASPSGTNRQQWGSSGAFGPNIEMLQQGSCLFIPSGATQGVTIWQKIPTASNNAFVNIEWVEF